MLTCQKLVVHRGGSLTLCQARRLATQKDTWMKYLGAHGLAPLVSLPPLGVPGGTSQRLWCRETADDNRLLTCFLDHTAPFRRQQERRSFTAEVWGKYWRMTAMSYNYTSSKSRNNNTHLFIFSCELVTQSIYKWQVTSHWVKVLKISVKIIANSSCFQLFVPIPIFWQTPMQSSGLWLTQLGTLLERRNWGNLLYMTMSSNRKCVKSIYLVLVQKYHRHFANIFEYLTLPKLFRS